LYISVRPKLENKLQYTRTWVGNELVGAEPNIKTGFLGQKQKGQQPATEARQRQTGKLEIIIQWDLRAETETWRRVS